MAPHSTKQTKKTRDEKVKAMINLAILNARNRTGALNYNRYGKKDGQGFQPCSEKFIDNFVLMTLVPDYMLNEEGNYKLCGQMNQTIHELLTESGLKKNCFVKATRLKRVDVWETVTEEMKSKVMFRNLEKEKPETQYFWQEYKVACQNEKYEDVMKFLRNQTYKERWVCMKDIDLTMDQLGSFNKKEVIDHMLNAEGFRMAQSHAEGERTILKNDHFVGRNCLTYMETVDDQTVRCKIYNKMVQMLECKAVREDYGNHWKDWVEQTRRADDDPKEKVNTRLADARDKSKDRGLTRAEVTFYCNENIPTDELMESVLLSITQYVPARCVYSTPHAGTWKAYCDSFVHSLVVEDKITEGERALIVYSLNEKTRKISGSLIDNWAEKRKWCLANLTLSATLPIDIIEINPPSVEIDEHSPSGYHDDAKMRFTFTMKRWMKQHERNGEFTTRLTARNGVYTCTTLSHEECQKRLETAGFLPHKNCVPELSHNMANKASRSYLSLRPVRAVTPRSNQFVHKGKVKAGELDTQGYKEMMDDMEIMQSEHRQQEVFIQLKEEYSRANKNELRKLQLREYPIRAIKKCGEKFLMLLDVGIPGRRFLEACTNGQLEDQINSVFPLENRQPFTKDGITFREGGSIGKLLITGRNTSLSKHVVVYAKIEFDTALKAHLIPEKDGQCVVQHYNNLPIIPRDEMDLYKSMTTLATLSVGSVHTVVRIGFCMHLNKEKLVVQLADGEKYQAGKDVEQKKEELYLGCQLLIVKVQENRSDRKAIAICQIVDTQDWAAKVHDYKTLPMFSAVAKKDDKRKVMDVKEKQMKGVKRKVALMDDGTIYRFKKSKLEENLKTGLYI